MAAAGVDDDDDDVDDELEPLVELELLDLSEELEDEVSDDVPDELSDELELDDSALGDGLLELFAESRLSLR